MLREPLFLLTTLACAACSSTEQPSSAQARNTLCPNATTQATLNVCASDRAKSAQIELAKTYDTLSGELWDEDARSLLKAAQGAWIAYRDKECAFESSGSEGGSVHPTAVAACMETMTRARQKELQRLLDCQEGDLSCVPLKRPN